MKNNVGARYFMSLQSMFGARLVHSTNAHQIFSALVGWHLQVKWVHFFETNLIILLKTNVIVETSNLIVQCLIQKMCRINLIKLIWPCITSFMLLKTLAILTENQGTLFLYFTALLKIWKTAQELKHCNFFQECSQLS